MMTRNQKLFNCWDARQPGKEVKSAVDLERLLYQNDFILAPTFPLTHTIAANHPGLLILGSHPCNDHTGHCYPGIDISALPVSKRVEGLCAIKL
jgi:hypothetical protein